MTIHFRDLAEQAASDGIVSTDDILELRRAGWADGRMEHAEAEALFFVNDKIRHVTQEWCDFFVESLCAFVVGASNPRGYVREEQADWLMTCVARDGHLDSMAELELLVRLLEKATDVPERLKEFALAQVEAIIRDGQGPTRSGEDLVPGSVTATEAQLLRRMVFAQGSERPAGVSRREAELLFRLKDATRDSVNAPEWKTLFVQGVANYLIGHGGEAPLSLERARELEAFMDERSGTVSGFVRRMASAGLGGFRDVFASDEPVRDRAAEIERSRAITTDEASWLDGRIEADDHIDDFDRALLAFIAEEQASVPAFRVSRR